MQKEQKDFIPVMHANEGPLKVFYHFQKIGSEAHSMRAIGAV
jgi:hypothetical protein